MSNPTQKQPVSDSRRKQVRIAIWSVVGTLLLILGVVVGFNIYSNIRAANEAKKTYPLGDSSKLEYIGASYSGTIPLLSDSDPSASYYYATDMSPTEVAAYFKKARLDNPDDLKSSYPPITFSLHSPSSDNPIYIYYYPDIQSKAKDFKLKPSTKKHLTLIQDEDYQAARDSL